MPGLADTVAMMANLKRGQPGASTPVQKVPQILKEAAFRPNPGALKMLLHVPEGLLPGAPLIVVLHGCNQSAEGFAYAAGWLTLADRCGFAVLAPEQSAANNPNRCFNWFDRGDAVRGGGEAASIRAMIGHAIDRHDLDPDRVFITGLSAGGAMAAVMLATYPEVFHAGAIVAGLPYGVATSMQDALRLMFAGQTSSGAMLGDLVLQAAPPSVPLPRVTIWHGDADTTVKPSNAAESAKQWICAHGLAARASDKKQMDGFTRLSWISPTTGEVMVETNIVHGLGHGTPLSTHGSDGIGQAGPFMLEAGVSSSTEIARFWGIDVNTAARSASPDQGSASNSGPGPAAHSLSDQIMVALDGHVSPQIKQMISKALQAAGLGR